MTVSVVIPVRDGERYLAEAIDSILGQTVPPHEVVVVDDGSTDATPDILARYGEPVHPLHIPASGIATAINRGVATTSGSMLAFLDSDDLWEATKLEHQLAILDADPALDAVFGLVRQFLSPDAEPATTASVWVPTEPVRGVVKGAILVRRAAFDRVGPFDSSYATSDFVDWWARALTAGLTFAVPDVVVARRRIHGDNTGIRRRLEQADNNLDILKAALDRRRQAGPTSNRWQQRLS